MLSKFMRYRLVALLSALMLMSGCTFKYSFTGASISPDVTTVSIQSFQNLATMVMPTLATSLTEALQDKFQRQTRLNLLKEDGDLAFEGSITNYTSIPIAVTSDEYASQNRLTITIQVNFTNKFDPSQNYNSKFSAYSDYDSSQLLTDVESTLVTEIIEQLVEDVFNAAVSNW